MPVSLTSSLKKASHSSYHFNNTISKEQWGGGEGGGARKLGEKVQETEKEESWSTRYKVTRYQVYKALNGMAPLYITELLSYRTCSRKLRSTDQKLLAVPKSRLKTYGDRAFSVAAPKLWNELPLDLRSLETINLFKKHLKTDLFKKAYNV